MSVSVPIRLGDRSYPIHIGRGLLAHPELLAPALSGRQVAVVSNETVAPLFLERLQAGLGGRHTLAVVIPDGERHKTLETAGRVFDALLGAGFDRGCTVVALGGGVVGDLAGFVAATYQRGVALVQVPTTLLAMVDSSVGGKTAVNHPRGKNMIGAFHQPRAVLADLDTLDSLPDREYRAGLAEVIKYGLIGDPEFFAWLEDHMDALLARDTAAVTHAVERSCGDKARVVEADERESGVRALLNLGHTFGHAIETATGYGRWLHGEAVAAGMAMAADLSHRLGWLTRAELDRTLALLAAAGLPAAPPVMTPDRFRELMSLDKKNRGGRLHLVLLRGIGQAVVTDAADPAALDATLAEFCARPVPDPA